MKPNSPNSPFKATLKNTFKFNDSAMKIKNSMMSTTMGDTNKSFSRSVFINS